MSSWLALSPKGEARASDSSSAIGTKPSTGWPGRGQAGGEQLGAKGETSGASASVLEAAFPTWLGCADEDIAS